MQILFKHGLFAMLALLACPAFALEQEAEKPLAVGIVPYMSTRALIEKYEPFRIHLEQTLGRPVKIYTANGFKPFYLNSEKGHYDLVVSAAHIGRVLQKEHDFTPLVFFTTSAHALLMTARNSPLKTVADLHGQVIAVPDRLALASIACMTYLRENKLLPGKNFRLLEVPSFPSAILSVQKGDAAAACSATAPLSQMPQEMQDSVHTLADAGAFPNLVILASPNVKKSELNNISQALLKINDDPNGGRQFIAALGFGPLIPATPKAMSKLDRFLAETKQLIHESPGSE